ncbi:protein HEADING DATE 3B-like isoform X2 [Phalaenopsis equestris]|uniref:protein HEADING DATE 3B-like isoform X2 n=1 Tax=Phalaenopsis equestris TaxID=78828 RepID=UPI0009E2C5B7|nr:protein HEADING DATE 3B-like isoform X2 [Phalaenopsis equestris]
MGTMKVGKEDDKSMRPMFPRVHVNDTEKGGPRAPPRNKMALYEQLSVPLQKFSSATLPPPKPGSAVSSASSKQGGTNERTAHSPFFRPHSMPLSSADKTYSQSSDGKSSKTRGIDCERTSSAAGSGAEGTAFKVGDFTGGKNSLKAKFDDDNDDFRVPTLAPSEVVPHSKNAPLAEISKPSFFCATKVQISSTLDSSIHVWSPSSKAIYEANASGKLRKRHERIHAEEEFRENISSEDPEAGQHNARMGNDLSQDGSLENRNAHKIQCTLSTGLSFGYSQRSFDEKAGGPGELKDTERSVEVSEASMIDSISVSDISPDDIVRVIGPKQFWKARRAIVNQQRVFAIQVFELHRLIKVQKLFAASPHLLCDDSDIITAPPKVISKNLPIPSILKSTPQRTYSSQKQTQDAAPQLEKAAPPPLQIQERDPNKELCPLPRNVPVTSNTHLIPMAPDNRQNPWCFQPPNQWLIPVMSPSEGLIYKPYSGPCPPPGFMPPLYGGGFMNSPYGFPSSHHQQNHTLPVPPQVGPNYFPAPYGIPMVNPVVSASAVEQVSPLTNIKSDVRSLQCSQSSCNKSFNKSEALSGYPTKNNPSLKDYELQASTASSPCDKAQGEGSELLPVFSIPPVNEGSCQLSQSSGKENPTQVIKVIPHNASSATESAARIFRSIQRERRQLDL